MIKIRGVYDGEKVWLLDQLDIPPETEVEVLVPDNLPGSTGAPPEDLHWNHLISTGLIKERPRPEEIDDSFGPIPNLGEPISDTIIRERR